MKKLLALGLLSSLVACSGAGGGASSASATSMAPADESSNVSDFTLTDIDGKSVSLSDHLGKKAIVLDFWATWCKPCIAEMAHMQKVYEEKKDQGLVILAISMDGSETEAQVAPTAKSKGWTFPVLLDSETRATSLYNPRRAAPYTVIIDRHGKIIRKREGFNPGDEVEMMKDIEAAMK
ncbi:MAG: TlpA family protein disulfide reductase [Deltaproteobacteria bacterium]|nr:TlpA family protein disulfide reductase [Deltaproteobacteria bacterium]